MKDNKPMRQENETAPQAQVQTLMKPIATPQQLIAYHGDMINLIQKALKEGTDYGKIPGTDKPTLYKAGAERINIAFGTHPEYELIEKEVDHDREVGWKKQKKIWNNKHQGDKTFSLQIIDGSSVGLYRYVYKCCIKKQDGTLVAEGDGACSTLENKYIDRPRDSENTVCKMAQKRAFMAATLHAFGLSDQFTQDLEDHYQPPQPPKQQQERSQQERQAPPPPPPPAAKVFTEVARSQADTPLEADLRNNMIAAFVNLGHPKEEVVKLCESHRKKVLEEMNMDDYQKLLAVYNQLLGGKIEWDTAMELALE